MGPIFGKDVANGADAEDPSNVVEAMDKEANVTEIEYGEDGLLDFVEETQQISTNDNSAKEVGGYANGSNSAKKSKKKERHDDSIIEMVSETMERLGRVYESTNENIKELTSCFKHESEGSNRRMSIFEKLMKIEGLTAQERVRVGMTICKDNNIIDFFMQVDPEQKRCWWPKYCLKILVFKLM
ncbi:uncharacterized protein LOC127801363 [Diospyros lotus]|uniref:uncharacterized protein LOC127801363 n=1 Tax=Diospyros lotus TaxID=55363 RepID=UPI0022507595|nr:uncharacterized protein LOC127801363 [Diospyros lotus]